MVDVDGLRPPGYLPLDLQFVDEDLNGPGGIVPPAYFGDVGFDLAISEDTRVGPRGVVDMPTGVRVALPDKHWGLIVGRSSTERKLGVRVTLGVIDWGYTGLLYVGAQSVDPFQDVNLKAGTRVAQLIVIPAAIPMLVRPFAVDKLPVRERGDNGFGSTG